MTIRTRLMAAVAAFVFAGAMFSAPVQRELGSAAVVAHAATAYTLNPKASVASGSYYSKTGFYVRLSYPGKNADKATIFYSLNGSEYEKYTEKIAITRNSTLKFYAQKGGFNSKVMTCTYKLSAKTEISHDSGSYTGAQTVTLTSPAPNMRFYYTTDGSTPTTSSKLYNGEGIKLTKSCTLKVLAFKKNWKNYLYTREYTIDTAKRRTTDLTENYTAKYAYNTLTPVQKKLYALLYEAVSEHEAKVDVSSYDITVDDVNTAFYAMDYENPQFFWLASGYSYSYTDRQILTVSPKYSRSKAEMAAIAPTLEAAAKEILDEASDIDGTFEQVLYVHDAIVDRTLYTTLGGEYKRDADGPLVQGRALCEGYSKAFAYLCQKLGYEVICVSGTGNGGPHMWNMIKLDGEWYHMDVTFDDPVSTTPICSYDNFCVTAKKLLEDHSIDNPFTVPAAVAEKYSYYNASGNALYTDAGKAYDALLERTAENCKKGIFTTEIYCEDAVITKLMAMIDSSFLTKLEALGCDNTGASFGFQGSRFYINIKT